MDLDSAFPPTDSAVQRDPSRLTTSHKEDLMVFHRTPSEHLEKLRRIVDGLTDREMHADQMDDFCKTAWHLLELVEKDPNSSRQMRRRASALRSDPDLAICDHAANTAKHGKARPDVEQRSSLSDVDIQKGWGVGGYGKGGFGDGEQSVTLILKDGTQRDALDLATAVLTKLAAIWAK